MAEGGKFAFQRIQAYTFVCVRQFTFLFRLHPQGPVLQKLTLLDEVSSSSSSRSVAHTIGGGVSYLLDRPDTEPV